MTFSSPEELQAAAKQHLWMHFTRMSAYNNGDIPVIVRGSGPYVYDDKGKRYLDGLSALYCVNVGHGRAEVAEAIGKAAHGPAFVVPTWRTPEREALVERLRRDNVMYRPLNEEKAVSPIIMSTRKGDKSPEIAFIVKLIREIYRKARISFGV